MQALLLLDKASGPSSNQALQQCRKLLQANKAGHCGTLDPLASGMLLVLLGSATRLARYATGLDKTYALELELGLSTDSYDIQGKVIAERDWRQVASEDLARCLTEFIGAQQQTPPAYSAIKVRGQRAYALARAGKEVKLAARSVHLYSATITTVDLPRVSISMRCSSGYYVRSLVHDLGERLGCGACLHSLRRTGVGKFSAEGMYSLEQLQQLHQQQGEQAWQQVLLPASELLDFPELQLNDQQSQCFAHGRSFAHPQLSGGTWQVYHQGRLLGLGTEKNNNLHPLIVLQ